MATPQRNWLTSVRDAGFTQKLMTAAADANAAVCFVSNEEAPAHAFLPQAECLILAFENFDPISASILDECRRTVPDLPVIAVLRDASATEVARFTRFGAFECLQVASNANDVSRALELAQAHSARLRATESAAALEPWRRHLVGHSGAMDQVTRIIRLVASRRCTVLITGETGTGKEMAARAIHLASDRARRPMVSINCSAIPENLIEAELFGHVKGAFTGAVNHRIGRFEQANGGTLFLDEIGELPLDLQAKLLRVLQEREVQRLGGSETIKLDVRVIAATNANLLARVQQGQFREDLYYRLNVVPIHLPALRDRTSDIELLARHFVQKICQAETIVNKELTVEAIQALTGYAWPGNVRQLENVVEHAVVMSGDRPRLYPSDFAIPKKAKLDAGTPLGLPSQEFPADGLDFTETLRQFERAILHEALSRAQGNKTLAADMLRLPRTTLIHKLRVLDQAAA